jgi:hypothetical protein
MTKSAAALLALVLLAGADDLHGRVRGQVIDGSGGVLPGVTVVAATHDGRVLSTVVSDGQGRYVFDALPPGPVRITFELDGFGKSTVDLVVTANAESTVVERLELAPLSETVEVTAKAPPDPPLPPRPRQPPAAAPVLAPVPIHDPESVCGPAKPDAARESFGTIRAKRHEAPRELYAKDEEILIDGGTSSGLAVGQNVVVRRYYRLAFGRDRLEFGEHTSGLIQIISADEHMSSAVVIYACDELMKGDFLATFRPEPMSPADPPGQPTFDDAARILFADSGQMLGVPRRMMVIDRGQTRGVRAGQRLTLFRRQGAIARPVVVGEAVVVAVRTDSATIKLERVIDAVSAGDWAAVQRPAQAAARR